MSDERPKNKIDKSDKPLPLWGIVLKTGLGLKLGFSLFDSSLP